MKKKGKIRSDKDQVLRCLLLPESLLSKRQEVNHGNSTRIGETWLLPKSSESALLRVHRLAQSTVAAELHRSELGSGHDSRGKVVAQDGALSGLLLIASSRPSGW